MRDILNSKNLDIKNNANGTKFIFDKDTGRGFSISRTGEFNGFRELDKILE